MSTSVLSLFKDGFGILAEKVKFEGRQMASTFENLMFTLIVRLLKKKEAQKFYNELFNLIGKRLQKL